MSYNNFKKIKKEGFTVIEALVSIAIMLLSITGAFAVAQSSLQSSDLVKNRVTAYYLAQEGIEFLRQKRDDNGLKMLSSKNNPDPNASWLSGIVGSNMPCDFDNVCEINGFNADGGGMRECTQVFGGIGGQCTKLSFDKSLGYFDYPSTDDSGAVFRREIRVTRVASDPTSDREVNVSIIVKWNQNGIERSLDISENLYNWQQI